MGRYAWVYFLDDPVFNSYLFNKFICKFVKDGKKLKIQKKMYKLFSKKDKMIPINLFFQVIERVRPGLINVPVRFGKNIERVPMAITESKSFRKAIFYISQAVNDRKYDHILEEKIFNEFFDMFHTAGYFNKYSAENARLVKENSHLKHFRRFALW